MVFVILLGFWHHVGIYGEALIKMVLAKACSWNCNQGVHVRKGLETYKQCIETKDFPIYCQKDSEYITIIMTTHGFWCKRITQLVASLVQNRRGSHIQDQCCHATKLHTRLMLLAIGNHQTRECLGNKMVATQLDYGHFYCGKSEYNELSNTLNQGQAAQNHNSHFLKMCLLICLKMKLEPLSNNCHYM